MSLRGAEAVVVLVCGDRFWQDAHTIRRVLEGLGPVSVVHGGAPGADRLVGVVAAGLGLSVQAYPAQWHQYGRAAGPLRNQEMLTDAKPDLVLAFHRNLARSRGTADMVRRARAAGVPVRVFTGKEETS